DILTVDTSDPLVRRDFERQVLEAREKRDRILRRAQVDCIDINSTKDPVDPLVAFFRRRRKS
ncbi:MAG: DUF58 domain-containing protein, partial [Bdellovibrionaceae bacterium]|nr:DUF58 domain-containing protein [Pseudobdellovibrionaceae bacterium]